MRCTLYEIETTLRKASSGTGLPFGLAEDIGKATTWLCEKGYNGVEEALVAINSMNGWTDGAKVLTGDNEMIFPDAKSAMCGPSVIDLLLAEKIVTRINLLNVDSAVLIMGFAGVAATSNNCEFQIEFSNSSTVRVGSNKVTEHGLLPAMPDSILITCHNNNLKNDAHAQTLKTHNGVEVNEGSWHQAEILAAKTLVPESKNSRASGAGALSSDND